MRPRLAFPLPAGLVLLGLAGCSATTTVSASVVYPAALPVRAYPQVWLATRGYPVESALAATVGAHLQEGSSDIREVLIDDLEPLRVQGRIPRRTAVVLLEADSQQDTVPRFGSRPETVCGPAGCYTTTRTYSYDVPRLTVALELTVYDGPSARIEQRVALRERADGAELGVLQARLVRRLFRRIRALVDQRREQIRVELAEVESEPRVAQALLHIEQGRWSEGRRMLERIPRGDAWDRLDRETRARVLYNLGQARRFDAAPGHPRFAAAERALRAAVRLNPLSLYTEALEALERHRRSDAEVAAQRETAAENFAASSQPPQGIPEPPPGYGQ